MIKLYLERVIGMTIIEEQKTPYMQWLEQEEAFINTLIEKYEEDTLSKENTKEFTKIFQKFLKNKLIFVKITRCKHNNNGVIGGMVLELTDEGYAPMKHPLFNGWWEIAAPLTSVSQAEKFHLGDIVRIPFIEVKNKKHLEDLIYPHFNNAKWMSQTIEEAYAGLIDPHFSSLIETKYDLPKSIEAIVSDYLLTNQKNLIENLQDNFQQQQEIEEKLNERKEKIRQEQRALEEEEKLHYETILKVRQLYETNTLVEDEKAIIPYNSELFFDQLQSLLYFNEEKSLLYEKQLLETFIHSLQANMITILSGPSGTGKTSIVEALGECLENVVTKIIPVQSSWTDTQDLLGYFHPVDKAFVPTPFMETLAEASLKQNENKLYIICLDEMNLAHIEYYFSEILSAREKQQQVIQLYPQKHQKIAHYIVNDPNSTMEQKINAEELIGLYPPSFTIPKNVRFVGTVNMDHTVKPLSPKVIDRSFLIEIQHLPAERKKELRQQLKEKKRLEGKIIYSYTTFSTPSDQRLDDSQLIKYLENLGEIVSIYPNAELNSRGYKHIRRFLEFAKNAEEATRLVDDILLGKVLPRFEFKRKDLTDEFIAQLTKQFKPYDKTSKKWQQMLQHQQTVHFW